jgi:hypothetical protein
MNYLARFALYFAFALAVLLTQVVSAQPFVYQNNDLALGFRKTGVNQENYEVVVNIGQASNYVSAAIGTTFGVTNFSATQLTPGSFTTLNNLTWSVFGALSGTAYGASYPAYTVWLTVPRTNPAVRSLDATRLDRGTQANIRNKILSILSNAAFVSHDILTASPYNTNNFIRESISAYPTHLLTVWMGSIVDNTVGTLNDTWPEGNLEITTAPSFSSAVRSDLYEIRPTGSVDPHTGQTTGAAYYVGYFQFNPNGTMTFTREAASTPPPPPTIAISRLGNTSTISFNTVSGATYSLHYTNSVGISAPLSSWATAPNTVSGTGNPASFNDVSSASDRFYSVSAH